MSLSSNTKLKNLAEQLEEMRIKSENLRINIVQEIDRRLSELKKFDSFSEHPYTYCRSDQSLSTDTFDGTIIVTDLLKCSKNDFEHALYCIKESVLKIEIQHHEIELKRMQATLDIQKKIWGELQ